MTVKLKRLKPARPGMVIPLCVAVGALLWSCAGRLVALSDVVDQTALTQVMVQLRTAEHELERTNAALEQLPGIELIAAKKREEWTRDPGPDSATLAEPPRRVSVRGVTPPDVSAGVERIRGLWSRGRADEALWLAAGLARRWPENRRLSRLHRAMSLRTGQGGRLPHRFL